MKTSIKKKKDKKLFKYIWVGYAVFSMFLVVYLANNLLCKDIMNVSNRLILNDNWNISINDTEYNNVALDSVKFDAVEKGDIILMETTLPKDWNFGQAALCIHNRHTALSMFIDDELEYQYGYERVEQNKTTGSGYLLINIYDSYKGKNLKLELAVTEMNAFSSFDSIWISEWNNSYRYIITENRLPMILGSFLVVFGFLVAFISIFAVTISKKYRNVLCLSLFSMCIGIWTLCYYNVVMVFSIPLYSISLMEYMSLFLAPIPILGYMYSYVKELQNNKFMIIYKLLFAVQIALTSVTIILHTTDTIHGVQSLPLYQVLFVIHSLYFSYVLYKNMKKNKMMRKFSLIGLFIVVACILYDLCSYSIFRYYGKHIINLRGMSSLGILIFIVILILDLYYRITRSMMEEQEKAILIKRAYTDELTQINNRGFCSEYMSEIAERNIKSYTIINFDLNGLKKANDAFGHAKGDELICAAAKIIEEAFSSMGVVGRMGGDEFIAILETGDKNTIEKLLTRFNTLIDEKNEEKKDLNLSISYGYATNNELSGASPEKVYQLADKRMYEYKRKIKLSSNLA